MPVVRQHMAWLVKPDDDALEFTSPEGAPLRRNFRQRVWLPALRAAGLLDIHFHDLPHTGNAPAASTGDLRKRMSRASGTVIGSRCLNDLQVAAAGRRRVSRPAGVRRQSQP